MQVILNGESREVPDRVSVKELLEQLGYQIQGRAVAVNRAFVPRSRHAQHRLHEGDEVEVVAPMQGG
jgi:sulfur carrier protein